MTAVKPIAILSADPALGRSLAFALSAEGFLSETYSGKDWYRGAQDIERFLCLIVDERALPSTSIERIGLAVPIILLADGLGSPVAVAGAKIIYKPSQGGDILALVRALGIPETAST